jgi:hypothetical protein
MFSKSHFGCHALRTTMHYDGRINAAVSRGSKTAGAANVKRLAIVCAILLAGESAAAKPPLAAGPERPAATRRQQQAPGPLRVHPVNPRYFTDGTTLPDGSTKVAYLTGSHTWANLIDRGPSDPPPAFDFAAYLDFLHKHNHNFIRLWGRQLSWYQNYGEEELHAGPLAWQRTGPGRALDGKPKFDLSKLDPAYFERLRSRAKAAGERDIYVSIMLFGGHAEAGPNWTGSPFHRDNNISGIDGDPNRDGSGWEIETLSKLPQPLADIQRAYVRKAVDTVSDLDNVLFEISNEGGKTSKEWQYELVRFIHAYERTLPKQHPVGMTAGYWSAEENRALLEASPADWISYLFEMEPPQGQEALSPNDPLVATGRKVSIQDSDHWWVVPLYGNAELGIAWVWKSFCRGHQPILMEHLPPRSFVAGDHPLTTDDPGYVASRVALGHTRRYAERIDLAAATPSKEIASTTYCLADPGREYLVFAPEGGSFTVDLSPAKGKLAVEWFDPTKDKTVPSGLVAGGQRREFQAPFPGAAVLYLHGQPPK